MITSVIRHRVADFLKQHAPFDALGRADLLQLAGSGKVKFHESEEYLFRAGDAKGRFCWVVQQGRVDLLEETPEGEQLRDVLGEGDMPGLEALASGTCRYSARTATDVVLYGVAVEAFEPLLGRYPEVQRFLGAHTSLAGNLGFDRASWLDAEAPPLDFLRARLLVLSADSAEEATAQLARASGEVAVLAGRDGLTGTLTAQGIRPPPPTLKAPVDTRAVVREMLRTGREEIALTGDGTPGGRLEGLLTASDLALFCGHQPLRLAREIRYGRSVAEIQPLLRLATGAVRDGLGQPHHVDDCARMAADALRALCEACIRLAGRDVHGQEIAPPEIPHCWVIFGAPARGDLLEPRLPAIAVLYDDSDARFKPEDSLYFVAVAGQALLWLSECGLTDEAWSWPAGAQPSMPLSEWKRLFSETIRRPEGHDLYARREFFDVSPLSGDTAMFTQLQEHVRAELRDCAAALPLLASDTLAHMPPLAFFSGLVLDLEGTPHDSFDIAKAILAPVTNAARVFALSRGRLAPVGTLERLEQAHQDFAADVSVLREAADAFRIGLYYQTLAGGARIDPARLGKFDQLLLKNAFASIQRFLEFAPAAL